MPHSQTILRAISVACSMSFWAPVEIWPKVSVLGDAAAHADRDAVSSCSFV